MQQLAQPMKDLSKETQIMPATALSRSNENVALNITTSQKETILLEPGKHYDISIAENTEATISGGANVDITLKDNAKLRYITVNEDMMMEHNIRLGRHAQLDWIDAGFGASDSNNTVRLQGAGANAKYRSAYLGEKNDEYRSNITMIHEASNTSSHMLTQAALLDHSKGTYRGTIRIESGAKHCDAHQREETLLIGETARMDAVPILEIQNDDVKCSHAVTLGQIDDEKLHYLASRGIPEGEAVKMIMQGFFDQILISMGEQGQSVREKILKRIGG